MRYQLCHLNLSMNYKISREITYAQQPEFTTRDGKLQIINKSSQNKNLLLLNMENNDNLIYIDDHALYCVCYMYYLLYCMYSTAPMQENT